MHGFTFLLVSITCSKYIISFTYERAITLTYLMYYVRGLLCKKHEELAHKCNLLKGFSIISTKGIKRTF